MVLRAIGCEGSGPRIADSTDALDTLCTQAYGAQPKLCSTLALRTGVVMLCVLPFQLSLAWHSESAFLALGQDPDVARLAARYFSRLSLSVRARLVLPADWPSCPATASLPALRR